MLRLDSFDRSDVVASFDPLEGSICTYQAPDIPDSLRSSQSRGIYAVLGGLLIALYRFDGDLYVRCGSIADQIASVTIEVRPVGRRKVLHIGSRVGGNVELSYVPGPPYGPPLADDPTPFIESEDWDFGLFLMNVADDVPRAARMYVD